MPEIINSRIFNYFQLFVRELLSRVSKYSGNYLINIEFCH